MQRQVLRFKNQRRYFRLMLLFSQTTSAKTKHFIQAKVSLDIILMAPNTRSSDAQEMVTFFFKAQQPQWVRVSSLSILNNHTQTQHTRQDSCRRVTGLTQRPLPDNPQHSQEIAIHDPAGFEPAIPANRAADPHLKPCGYWNRQMAILVNKNY